MSSNDRADRLSNLLAVTDTSLSRLDLQDLLSELLDRIRTILDADTAAVLMREPGSIELVARAACGLEEEVRQGVTVSIGTGFAGAIAARKEPVFLERVDASTVANPILWEKGVRVMLGVPLLAGDELIGVLHVGRLTDRAFDPADAELLQVAADRVASATQARQLAIESAAARLLERSLQPPRLPEVPGLALAGRYIPAESRTIGGDWYDAFVLPSGELWLVAGDVAGHGLNAAVVMGRVKSALRSYALNTTGPDRVLELTDRKVQHFEIGTMVTLVCATSMPPFDRFQVCSAGHLPPILASPGCRNQLLELPIGPPLGALPDIQRTAVTIDLPASSLLLLYTDGLVERRGQPIDEALEHLRNIVEPVAPEVVCQTVLHELVGSTSTTDDIALLAVRRTG